MAKFNMAVNNDLEDIKLTKNQEKKNNKKSKPKNVKSKKDASKSVFTLIMNELKLVTWPSKKDIIKYTIATLALIIFLSLLFLGINLLFDLIYGLVQGWVE